MALGSDFDGGVIPQDVASVAGLPNLFDHLARAGYPPVLLRKIASENWLAVLARTWDGSSEIGRPAV